MFRLCYSELPWLWFTDAEDFSMLHTDDWDDGYRQGAPYEAEGYTLIRVALTGPFRDANMPVSPDTINEEELAWIETRSHVDSEVLICAKCPLERTLTGVEQAGGELFIPTDVVESSSVMEDATLLK